MAKGEKPAYEKKAESQDDRAPTRFVVLGGICFVLSFIVWSGIALFGLADGIYILRKYPHKKIHGIIPIILNGWRSIDVIVLLAAYAVTMS